MISPRASANWRRRRLLSWGDSFRIAVRTVAHASGSDGNYLTTSRQDVDTHGPHRTRTGRAAKLSRTEGLRPMPKLSHLVFTFCVLLAVNTMNFYDRQVLPAVQEKIRKDWKLSDTQLGSLGAAFILLYAVVGLPLGRLADRWDRRRLLAAGVALWSVMTILGGFATGFWSLFVLRLCVAIGE